VNKINIPDKLIPLFTPARGELSYRIMYGGRGSAKSVTAAQMALLWAINEPLRILCVRQFQNSIADSFFAELKNALEITPEMQPFFEVQATTIKGINGSEFLFKGIERNTASIKSLSGIDLTIIEEAEQVKEDAYRMLLPTVRRRDKGEVWILTNPREENSATDMRFIKRTPERAMAVNINYDDNPFFPSGLKEERQSDFIALPYPIYAHIWEGEYLTENEFSVYKRDWFKDRHNYTINDWQQFSNIYHSWDTAFKTKEANDPSAGLIIGTKADNRAYLLHVVNERMDYPALRKKVIEMHQTAPATVILVEDAASGQVLVPDLKPQGFPMMAIKPEGDKYTRAYASAEFCAAGSFILPNHGAHAPWLPEYEKQLFFFTGNPKIDKHDDMVDATSQFINYIKKRKRYYINGVWIDG
jgi:PBSX family phage terminase large subunit